MRGREKILDRLGRFLHRQAVPEKLRNRRVQRPRALHLRIKRLSRLRRSAIEKAGVEFIHENGGGPGVRLRKGQQKKR